MWYLQEIFARVGERSHASWQLTWSVAVIPVVDGPGRVTVGLTVHGQVAVAGHCDALLGGNGVIVDAAVAGQLGEGAQWSVRTRAGSILSTDILGSCDRDEENISENKHDELRVRVFFKSPTNPSGSGRMIARIWPSCWATRYGQSFLSVV